MRLIQLIETDYPIYYAEGIKGIADSLVKVDREQSREILKKISQFDLKINPSGLKNHVLDGLIPSLTTLGEFEPVRELIPQILGDVAQAAQLRELWLQMAKAEDRLADEVYEEAYLAGTNVKSEFCKAKVLLQLANALSQVGDERAGHLYQTARSYRRDSS